MSYRCGGGTSLTFPTSGTANRVLTGVRTHHDPTPVLQLQDNLRNRPRGERSEDDGALRPCKTPCLMDRTIGKGERILTSRRTDHFRFHDDVQRDPPFGADGDSQRQHTRVETSDHQPEDVVNIQSVLPLITPRADNRGNNLRKSRVQHDGAKHK